MITNEQLDELESLAKRASGGDWVLVTEDEYAHILWCISSLYQ